MDVVMFGDNVPPDLVGRAYEHVGRFYSLLFIYFIALEGGKSSVYTFAQVDRCDSLLVIGTSLEVFSAYRFVRRSHQNRVKIAIVNFGETRAERDKLASIVFKSDANCAELLHAVANEVVGCK